VDTPEADRAAGCDDAEILRCCGAHKRLFKHFDALIHCCHHPFGTLSDNDVSDVRRLVEKLDRSWRRAMDTVPPKAHNWWHLLEDLERFRGLKHHSESKIEKSHQDGRRVDLLFRGANDVEKKIIASLRHQHALAKPEMKVLQSKAREQQSRKRKAVAVQEDGEDDDERHRGTLLLLDSPEVNDHFPSFAELAVAGRKAHNNNNNADNPEQVIVNKFRRRQQRQSIADMVD